MSEQERQAKVLYNKLLEIFSNSLPETIISIKEPGLHWCCSLSLNDKDCAIYCFGKKGFAISFNINDRAQARGRTLSEQEIISSVLNWLKGSTLNELHDNFEFIDPGKRALEKFWELALNTCPELDDCVNISLDPGKGESFNLHFVTSQRFCQIYFNNQSRFPICEFYWRDIFVFYFLLDDNFKAVPILRRWFCDNAMPSDLAKEFSWLDTTKLSQLYDFGKVVEAEFSKSWDRIENFYKTMPFINLNISSISKLIAQLRQKEFDKTLRAGQSLSAFVLSRSLHHGLRNDQPRLMFVFNNDNLEIYASNSTELVNSQNLSFPRIELTSQIEKMLKLLEREEIN